MTIKTVWINGTKKLCERNRYGAYEVYLDYNDVIWLNKVHERLNKRR